MMGSFVAGAVVLIIAALAIVYLVKSKKGGKPSCGGGCASCPMSGGCRKSGAFEDKGK